MKNQYADAIVALASQVEFLHELATAFKVRTDQPGIDLYNALEMSSRTSEAVRLILLRTGQAPEPGSGPEHLVSALTIAYRLAGRQLVSDVDNEVHRLINALRAAVLAVPVPPMKITRNDDGYWLHLTAPDGKMASICLDGPRGPFVASVLNQVAIDQTSHPVPPLVPEQPARPIVFEEDHLVRAARLVRQKNPDLPEKMMDWPESYLQKVDQYAADLARSDREQAEVHAGHPTPEHGIE